MSRRSQIHGPAIPVRGNDIDTDRIIPARFLRTVTFEGLGEHAFEDDRAAERREGKVHPFEDPRFAAAKVLLVNANFGCGSSREHAPQAIVRACGGIATIVGESFAEIFFGNCVSLGVPCVTASPADVRRLMERAVADPTLSFVVDLEQKLATAGDLTVAITVPEGARKSFLAGSWDSLGELLGAREQVLARTAAISYFRGYSA